ncbi:hypothetical protein P879_06994 [Paragonimus westermani]|uniref:MSP domain-containing protein n=1 Tax=Paragonimus westermani TaxID=34504 RepID=A0A8T0CY11_9TREM|nr:hypothetical protein P879_06994 [Paragonimus westermani]
MEQSKGQLLDIEPKKALYFEGPFTDIVTSYIQLHNPQDHAVCFKVKTTVPKRYCVRPSSGVLQAKERLTVAVMLQPFNYDPLEKTKHKFMIQSMLLPDGDHPSLDLLWKEADSDKMIDLKLICVLRMPGELAVEPSHDLVFEGPFTKPVSSTVTLTNPSRDPIFFKIQASSPKLSATPGSGVVNPNETTEVLVKVKPLDPSDQAKIRERLLIQSLVLKDSETQSPEELLETSPTTDTILKCVFRIPGMAPMEDKIKPVKQTHSMASAADSSYSAKGGTSVEALLNEIQALRVENKTLKEADIQHRRAALSDTCLHSAVGGGAAIGRQGALGAIASVPPILYLILALLIGLFLGKFAL